MHEHYTQPTSTTSSKFFSRMTFVYANLLALLIFFAGLIWFGYQQLLLRTPQTDAYPTTPQRPARALSFQGRLIDTASNPITTTTAVRFYLFNTGPSIVGGTQLWDSGSCNITPDQDGIFSVSLGSDCGSEIPANVFSENLSVWLEVHVGAETLSPRQRILTSAYSLNTETIQGYPISATGAATLNTVLVMDNYGDVVLGENSPGLRSISGTFGIEGRALLINTASGSNGDITMSPDGVGGVIITSTLDVQDDTTLTDTTVNGTLTVNGTTALTGYLAAPGATFSATYAGGTALIARGGLSGSANILALQNNGGSNLLTVDSSGNISTLGGVAHSVGNVGGNLTLASNGTIELIDNTNITGTLHTTGAITSDSTITGTTLNGTTGINTGGGAGTQRLDSSGNLTNIGTTQFNSITYSWPGTQSSGYILQTNGSGVLTWADPAVLAGALTFWTQGNGALFAKNSTVDLLVGGQSSSSAKFAVLNVNSGTPTASVSAGTNGAAYLTADGNLATTANQNITIGGSTTGNVTIAENTTITGSTDVQGALTADSLTVDTSSITLSGAGAGISFTNSGNHDLTASSGTLRIGAATLLGAVTGNGQAITGLSQLTVDNLRLDGNTLDTTSGNLTLDAVGTLELIGTTNVTGDLATTGTLTLPNSNTLTGVANYLQASNGLSVGGGTTYRITSTGDLFANAVYTGGTSRLTSTGNLTNIGTTQFNGVTYTWPGADGSAGYALTTDGSGTLSWSPTAANYWRVASGALSPINDSLDLLIGSNATTSAKFGFLNVNSGTPTASIAGSVAGYGLYMTGDGTISTTLNRSLALNPNGGRVGIGTTAPLQLLEVKNGNIQINTDSGIAGNFNLYKNGSPVARFGTDAPNSTAQISTFGSVDLFITPASGRDVVFYGGGGVTEIMRVDTSSGNVGIGATTPGAKFNVIGAGGANVAALIQGGTSQNGDILQITDSSGVLEYFSVNPATGIVLNEVGSSAVDTRIEGDTNINLLFADASADRVGIGTDTPDARLDSLATSGEQLRLTYNDGSVYSGFTVNSSGDLTLSTTGGNILSSSALNIGGGAASDFNFFGTSVAGASSPEGLGDLYIEDELEVDGTTRFGNVTYTWPGADGTSGYVLSTDGSGTLSWVDNGAGGSGSAWTIANGSLYPINETLDLLVGGTATSSAKAGFINITAGTPTATVSAGTTGGAYLSALGNLTTTAMQTLTLGGSTTGNLQFQANGDTTNYARFSSDGTDLTFATTDGSHLTLSPAGQLRFFNASSYITNAGDLTLAGDLAVNGGNITAANPLSVDVTGGLTLNPTNQLVLNSGAGSTITLDSGANLILDADSGIFVFRDSGVLFASITQSSSDAVLDVSGGQLILSNSNTINIGGVSNLAYNAIADSGTATYASSDNDLYIQDILEVGTSLYLAGKQISSNALWQNTLNVFHPGYEYASIADLSIGGTSTASAKFHVNATTGDVTLANQADLRLTDSGSNYTGFQAPAVLGASTLYTLPTGDGSNGSVLQTNGSGTLSWYSIPNYWRIASGAISPVNDTLDLLIGSNASASAKAGFINITAGTPTATVSAGATGGSYLTAAGVLATTANQTLALGNATTGNVQLNPGGTTTLTALMSGSVGIGTTTPNSKLDVLSTSGSQLRLSYDTSNYLSTTVGSTGATTFATTGAGGTYTFNSSVADGAVTGFTINTTNTLSNASAKVASIKNNSTELFYVDAAGNIWAKGNVYTDKGYGLSMKNIGVNLNQYDLVVINTTENNSDGVPRMSATDSAYTNLSYGVVQESCTTGSTCKVVTEGETLINVNAATNRGDYLYASTTMGQALPDNDRLDGIAAVATSDDATGPTYQVEALLLKDSSAPNGNFYTQTASVANGDYVEITHSQGTNDVIANGWFTDGSQLFSIDTATQSAVAVGGTITTDGLYNVHRFTSDGTFLAPGSITADVLLVGGGGSGGAGSGCCGPGGGGGAGDYVYQTSFTVPAGFNSVVVGDGGPAVAGPGGVGNANPGNNGEDTTFAGLTAIGGGGGGAGSAVVGSKTGKDGGSGGGGGTNTGTAGTQTGTGTGNNGANGSGANSGGGGGAGAAGSSTAGGNGLANSITGSSVTYAGGGGGALNTSTGGAGGTGGGGAGGSSGAAGTAGTANTGGGGGGGGNTGTGASSGAGGSGVVIIRYNSTQVNSPPYQIIQTDSNTVRLYNFSGVTKTLRLDAIVKGSSGSSGTEASKWQVNNGSLSPLQLGYDINLGATASSAAKISLAGALDRGRAAVIINQTENQDIFAASASGLPRFRIANDGYVYAPRYADQANSSYFFDGAATDVSLTAAGKVGFGTTAPEHQLQVSAAVPGKALTVLNETGNQSILVASSSGTRVFEVGHDGDVTIGNAVKNDVDVNLYGDIFQQGGTNLQAISSIVDTFIYDTTTDSDQGAWTNSLTSRGLSWYNETKDDGIGDLCSISSDDRCGKSAFPKKAIIVTAAQTIYIFDAQDNSLWMKIGTASYKSYSSYTSAVAKDGVIYVTTHNGSAGGLRILNFKNDTDQLIYSAGYTYANGAETDIDSRDTAGSSSNVINSSMTISVVTNDVSIQVINGKTYAAVATDTGLSVVNMSDGRIFSYSDVTSDNYNSVWLTSDGTLYGLNETQAQLEKWGSVHLDTTSELNGTPDKVYDQASTPALSATAPTISAAAPDALYVAEGTGSTPTAWNTIFVGTNQGLTRIAERGTNNEADSSVKYYTKDYISEEMMGDVKLMLPFATTAALGTNSTLAAGDTDLTRLANVFTSDEAASVPTKASGVRGYGLSFDGGDYVCSGSAGTCADDADLDFTASTDFTVSAWVKHPTSAAQRTILAKGTAVNTVGYKLYMTSGDALCFGIDDDTSTFPEDSACTSTFNFDNNQWHHVVGIKKGTTSLRLFVDGNEMASDTSIAATGTLDNTGSLRIGMDSDGTSNGWAGSIDDVMITAEALAPGDITAMYLAGRQSTQKRTIYVTDATSATSTTITDSSETWTPNEFVGTVVELTGGTGSGQSRTVVANTATTLTVSPAWQSTPDTTTDFAIRPAQFYGSTSTVTAVSLGDNDSSDVQSLYVGTSDGSDGGGLTVLRNDADYTTDIYHGSASKADEANTAWNTTADYDDIVSVDAVGNMVSIGAVAKLWTERTERSFTQVIDELKNQVGTLTKKSNYDQHIQSGGTNYDVTNQVIRKGRTTIAATGVGSDIITSTATISFGITYDDIPIVVTGTNVQTTHLTASCGNNETHINRVQNITQTSFQYYRQSGSGCGAVWSLPSIDITWLAIGSFTAAGNTSIPYAAGADLAEWYATPDETLQAGEIVSVNKSGDISVTRSSSAYDASAIGIVATQPSIVLGPESGLTPGYKNQTVNGGKAVAVALAGRVPVKVSLENGVIEPGDALTTSSTPGVAMKATQAGPIIGKAMEKFDGSTTIVAVGTAEADFSSINNQSASTSGILDDDSFTELDAGIGTIMAFVNTSYADPSKNYTSNTSVTTDATTGGTFALDSSGKLVGLGSFNPASFQSLLYPEIPLTNSETATASAQTATISATVASASATPSRKDLIALNLAKLTNLGTLALQELTAVRASILGRFFAQEIETPTLNAEYINSDQIETEAITAHQATVEELLTEDITTDKLTTNTLTATGSASFLADLTVQSDASIAGSLVIGQNASVSGEITATSARLQALESQVAHFQDIKTQTADIVNATVSGTLYADTIADLDQKIADAFKKPSLLELLTTASKPATTESTQQTVTGPLADLGYLSSASASGLTTGRKTLAQLNLNETDTVVTTQAAFINQYFDVNGSAYIADSLGIGSTLTLGSNFTLADGAISYQPSAEQLAAQGLTKPVLKLQPSGFGVVNLLAGTMILDDSGLVTINGDLIISGNLTTNSLLTGLIEPKDYTNPLQVKLATRSGQVAGATTDTEPKVSRFEIVNELGTPVATISAGGKASFEGGVGVGSETVSAPQETPEQATATKTSGKATIKAQTNQLSISSALITDKSLIYVTPVGSTGNQVLYVKEQTVEDPTTDAKEGKFVVGFDNATTQDVTFNWWIVN